jgi:hypothetical protein
MKRLPLVLSAAALLVALLGSTAVGPAAAELAANVVPFAKVASKAGVADNAKRLNGRRSSPKGIPNTIPVIGADGKLPVSIGAVGPQGPKGDKGSKGDKGPKGDPGPKGSPGITDVKDVVVSSDFSSTKRKLASAFCPAGTRLVGGGVDIKYAGPFQVFASFPDGNGWTAIVDSDPVVTYNWRTQVHALCATLAPNP